MPKHQARDSSRSVQDYLRGLALRSSLNSGNPVSTSELSQYLDIAPASVTEMLKKLELKGYVIYSPYHGTLLTQKGTREAQRITRKHRLLEKFLFEVLHIPKGRVHAQACNLEHALSDEAEESICRILKHPDRCPDDEQIIPACDLLFSNCEDCMSVGEGRIEKHRRHEDLVSVASLKPGSSGKISFIREEHDALQKLLQMGVVVGAQIEVEKALSAKGPFELCLGSFNVFLDQNTADNVFVEIEKIHK